MEKIAWKMQHQSWRDDDRTFVILLSGIHVQKKKWSFRFSLKSLVSFSKLVNENKFVADDNNLLMINA
jgi:hypothetical protein